VEVEPRAPRELDMAVELEPRDTENLESTTLPVNSDTKVKTELMELAVEDVETVKEEKVKEDGVVLPSKETRLLRKLPPSKEKPSLKRPRLKRPLRRFKKSLRKRRLVLLMKNILRPRRPLPSNSPVPRKSKKQLKLARLLKRLESLVLRLSSPRTTDTLSVKLRVLNLWDSPSVAVMTTTTSRLNPAEVAVEVVEEEAAAVALPEVTSREAPDKREELLRAERLSWTKRPSPPCDDRSRLNA